MGAPEGGAVIRSLDDLLEPFVSACKPVAQHRIGVESEKFGVYADGTPVPYEGERGVMAVFSALEASGWRPVREQEGGPVIALERDGASVTLEPGAQLELSGAPLDTVHEIDVENRSHLSELEPLSQTLGLHWLAVGFHPLARQEELPWVPKDRYVIMRAYFPEVGTRGLDMMRRTATVQANLDYESEEDAMRKLRVALKLAPIAAAMFASSPFREGKPSGLKCERAAVWLDTDRYRTGLLPQLLEPGKRFVDYVEWALDVPMYLIKREGAVIANTGQTFRQFWHDGCQGHRANSSDWLTHLNTLFPEARLKRTLEVRSVDSQGRELLPALPALWAGLLYDGKSLAAVEALSESWSHQALDQLRHDLPKLALAAELDGEPLRAVGEAVLELAEEGLARRKRRDAGGRDETGYLEPLIDRVSAGRCPADELVEGLPSDPAALRAEIIKRTRA